MKILIKDFEVIEERWIYDTFRYVLRYGPNNHGVPIDPTLTFVGSCTSFSRDHAFDILFSDIRMVYNRVDSGRQYWLPGHVVDTRLTGNTLIKTLEQLDIKL